MRFSATKVSAFGSYSNCRLGVWRHDVLPMQNTTSDQLKQNTACPTIQEEKNKNVGSSSVACDKDQQVQQYRVDAIAGCHTRRDLIIHVSLHGVTVSA